VQEFAILVGMHNFIRKINTHQKLIMFFGCILLSTILYHGNINGKFVFEDVFFTSRKELRQPQSLWSVWWEPYQAKNVTAGSYRPMSVFFYTVNFVLFGESPLSFHITNILLNACVTFLLYILLTKFFGQSFGIVGALLFTVLPIHTEVVAFIKSRDELLSCLFILLSWLFFLRKASLKSSVMYLAALLSKESSFIAPILFICIERGRKKLTWKTMLISSLWYAATGGLYLLLRIFVLGEYAFGNNVQTLQHSPLAMVSIPTRLFTSAKILTLYMGKIIFPVGYFRLAATHFLNQISPVTSLFSSPAAVGGIVLFILFVVFAMIAWRKFHPLTVGAAIFLIPYFLVSQIYIPNEDLVAERWMYVPSIGIIIIYTYILLFLFKKKWIVGLSLFCGLLLFYGYSTINRNQVWTSNRALFESMIRDAPNSFQGYFGLASVEAEEGNLEKASENAQKAYTINPNYPLLSDTLGIIFLKEGRFASAELSFLKAIELDPQLAQSYSHLSILYYVQKEYEKSLAIQQKVLALSGDAVRSEDVVVAAMTLAKLRRYQESLQLIALHKLDFSIPQVRFVLAIDHFKLGNLQEAKQYFDWDATTSEAAKLKMLEDF
jgi:Tfp pilus assembly protein PilF